MNKQNKDKTVVSESQHCTYNNDKRDCNKAIKPKKIQMVQPIYVVTIKSHSHDRQ